MISYTHIYTSQAAEYHRMIAREDADSNLLPAILETAAEDISSLHNVNILDVGTGTGRIPLLFAKLKPEEQPRRIVALDFYLPMLREHQRQREAHEGSWQLINGDLRYLPIASGSFDLVIAGWAIGHFCGWYESDWQSQVDRGIRDLLRVVKIGGTVLIIETMSTGSLEPAPPSARLAAYYRWLEDHWGFKRRVISTDYAFANSEQAVQYTEFFFGAELTDRIRAYGWSRLPEWTGIWSLRK